MVLGGSQAPINELPLFSRAALVSCHVSSGAVFAMLRSGGPDLF